MVNAARALRQKWLTTTNAFEATGWKDWLADSLLGGAGGAHSYVKRIRSIPPLPPSPACMAHREQDCNAQWSRDKDDKPEFRRELHRVLVPTYS